MKFYIYLACALVVGLLIPGALARATTLGPISPTSISATPVFGGSGAMSSASSATGSDDARSTGTSSGPNGFISPGYITDGLVCTFDLGSIPSASTIDGVTVSVEGQSGAGSDIAATMVIATIGVEIGGEVASPLNKFQLIPAGPTDTTLVFGGATDNWAGVTRAHFDTYFIAIAGWDSASDSYAIDDITLTIDYTDSTQPTAVTITPATTGPTTATSVDIDVTFDEHVTNFDDASDVVFVHTGTNHSGVSISGGPATYTVSVTGITGTGAFTLAASTTSDIEDLVGNALLSSVTSAAVVIDNTGPGVSIGAPSQSISADGPVTYTVTYTDAAVVSLSPSAISLDASGASGTISVSDGTTDTPTVTISELSGDGTLGITIGSETAADSLGNLTVGTGPSTTFTVANTPTQGVFVDFSGGSSGGTGAHGDELDTLGGALATVDAAGVIGLDPGTSTETPTINQSVTLERIGDTGTISIGVAPVRSGFVSRTRK